MSEVITLLSQLVRIDSVNPSLSDGGAGESQAADFVGEWFQTRGFDVTRLESTSGRPSIVAVAKGTGGGKTLMFNGHLDTVSVESYDGDPFDPKLADGWLYGRGSADMKSGVAAMMIAASRAAQSGLAGDIIVTCVADEEHASLGTQEVIAAGYHADAAVVPEPVGHKIVAAHKGFIWFDLVFEGVAAHGSNPDKGVDAIVKAGKFLVALENYAAELAQQAVHPLVGVPSVHASLIKGGVEMSSYPAQCKLSIERRTLPRETPDEVEAEIEQLLNNLGSADPAFKATLKRGLVRLPYECVQGAEIIDVATRSILNATGRPAEIAGMNGWTDCALLGEAGIPAILVGPEGRGGHSKCESVSIQSVETLTDILFQIATDFCATEA
ncbi:ArgE/DapE family deacylase [Cognatishimia activa]|uniref:Probable succinyl-diaminopimelate desuccinylase n=1 Tax=Cognatishimia activa TaxID=1715691 RepID=A0A0P1IPN7_9RHOB|nr:ArgE/DapE family deacylase [Cognatishimia activa]CUI84993.1 Acetylornithine deacetylase [Cognatishimia activa]CUK25538.1 Acetylornithine deacetylase [Cognatishimia activa]